MRTLLLATALLVCLVPSLAATEIESYAIVQEDGSLSVQGHTIRLFGIYIPPTDTICGTTVRPVRCLPRAALALDTKIQGFVRCEDVGVLPDGSISAICLVRGDGSVLDPPVDLSAWMLEQGWAVALPDAPFEYQVLGEIARTQERGIWGFQVDSVETR
jgi:endonuclease YncB( thermonuclease family)